MQLPSCDVVGVWVMLVGIRVGGEAHGIGLQRVERGLDVRPLYVTSSFSMAGATVKSSPLDSLAPSHCVVVEVLFLHAVVCVGHVDLDGETG